MLLWVPWCVTAIYRPALKFCRYTTARKTFVGRASVTRSYVYVCSLHQSIGSEQPHNPWKLKLGWRFGPWSSGPEGERIKDAPENKLRDENPKQFPEKRKENSVRETMSERKKEAKEKKLLCKHICQRRDAHNRRGGLHIPARQRSWSGKKLPLAWWICAGWAAPASHYSELSLLIPTPVD